MYRGEASDFMISPHQAAPLGGAGMPMLLLKQDRFPSQSVTGHSVDREVGSVYVACPLFGFLPRSSSLLITAESGPETLLQSASTIAIH